MEKNWRQINGKISILKDRKKSILLKYLYYPNQSTNSLHCYQNSNSIFHRNRTNPKIYMEQQKIQIAKAILRKKNKAGSIIHAPWFQTVLQSYSNQTTWESKNKHMHICQLISDKRAKNTQ